MWAVGSESPDAALVQELLKRGVDPNTQNSLGETALTWASLRGDALMVERLKAAGASDVNSIRRSVENAIAVLQKSGPQFVKVSGCVSCHYQSLPQMAYAAARERGFRVDAAVSEQQVKAVVAMVKAMREQVEKKSINLPNPGISVSYPLMGLAAEGYAPDDMTAAMTLAITRTQLPDGSFAVFPWRPPLEASRFTSTALSIRALQLFGQDCDDKLIRPREWLKQAQPATQENRTMKLFGLVWSKVDEREIGRASAELLAQQRPDGGWAQLSVSARGSVPAENTDGRWVRDRPNAQQPGSAAQGERLSLWQTSVDLCSWNELGGHGTHDVTTQDERADGGWPVLTKFGLGNFGAVTDVVKAMSFENFAEEVQVLGRDLVDKIRDLIHEGNVQRIVVKDEHGNTFVEIPVTVAAVGVIMAPLLAAIGAISALVGKFNIVIVRNEPAPPERGPQAPGQP